MDRAKGKDASGARGVRVCACGTRLSKSNPGTRCGRYERTHAQMLDQPPVMPYEFWAVDRYREPFASRDIGKVLRAFRTDARHEEKYGEGRITQRLLGSWLGLS